MMTTTPDETNIASFQEMIKKVNKYLWDFYNLHSIIIAIAGFGEHVGKILYANRWAHRLLKYSPGTLIGKNVTSIMKNDDDRDHHNSYLREYLTRERLGMVLNEGRIVDARDGEGNLLPSYLSVIEKDIDGQRVFIGFMTDLSIQTKAMESAQAAAATKANFLASMSHEIRTPMNSIIGRADLISQMNISPEVKEHVEVILGAGENLIKIINDILDFSKVEAGKIVMEKICFDLHLLIDKIINIMRTAAENKGLNLKSEISSGVPQIVIGDPTKLHQIIINLISNAIKFTGKGEVACMTKVEAKSEGEAVIRFSITDTGVGIPKNKLEGIFAPFSQADSSTTREFGGTGLGLSITKEFVEMMNGNIWVDSIVGKGCAFHFTVLFDLSYECKLEKEEEAEEVFNEFPQSILLVEDNDENINLIKLFLKERACNLDIAKNGKRGLEKFIVNGYDLILMDIEMPVMDGWEATEKIRQWERENFREETPLVILTAHALDEHKKRALEIGANEFITKPTKKNLFIKTLGKYMAKGAAKADKAGEFAGLVIEIDKELEDIIPQFQEALDGYTEKLDEAIRESNFEQIRSTGHSMKGSGNGYGFSFVSEAGEHLEESARKQDMNEIRRWTERFKDYRKGIEIRYV